MPRPSLIEDLAYEMFLVHSRHEEDVREWERDLYKIFDKADKKLAEERAKILSRVPADGDKVRNSNAAIARIDRLRDQIRQAINSDLIDPAKMWADRAIRGAYRNGRSLAKMNLSFDLIDRDAVRESFRVVRAAERGVLEVGFRDTYRILDTIGDDVADSIRDAMTDAAIRGIPIQGKGDTLENAIFEGGRLKPQTIKTAEGKIIKRSLRQRAIAVARVETAKVYNRIHELKATEVLGDLALFANANPEDTRTTPICQDASNAGLMTLAQWDKSRYGRPPRLRPDFHLCRSFLVGGTRRMFDDADGADQKIASAARKIYPKKPDTGKGS